VSTGSAEPEAGCVHDLASWLGLRAEHVSHGQRRKKKWMQCLLVIDFLLPSAHSAGQLLPSFWRMSAASDGRVMTLCRTVFYRNIVLVPITLVEIRQSRYFSPNSCIFEQSWISDDWSICTCVVYIFFFLCGASAHSVVYIVSRNEEPVKLVT
jgi:hypothetical protein